jgi:hypothetical protein
MKASTHCLPVPGHARGLHPNIKIVPTASPQKPATSEANRADARRLAAQLPVEPFEHIWPAAIVPTASGPQPSYRRALRAHLASGNGLDDIQAVALDEISTITASGPLPSCPSTPGASTLQGGRLPSA